jgi:hypothetical protein
MLGHGAPLALLLFFLFPRIEGPLWGMPGDAAGALRPVRDSMAPGTWRTWRSRRAGLPGPFFGRAPPQEQLYWRGPVLGDYDGRTWTRRAARPGDGATCRSLSSRGKGVGYEVTLEPNNSRWLFALEMPRACRTGRQRRQRVGEFELTAARRSTSGCATT